MYSHAAANAANSATEDRPNGHVTSCETNQTSNKKRKSSSYSATDEMPPSVSVENLSTPKSEHVSNSQTVTASYPSPNVKVDMNSSEFLYSIHLPPPPIPPQIIVLDGPSSAQVRAPSPQFGWSRHYSSNGSPYFYNASTGASSYRLPNGWSESGVSPLFSPQPNTTTPAKVAPLQSSIVSTPPNAFFPEIFNSPVDMEISPRDDPQQNERVEMRVLNAPPPKKMTTLIDISHKHGVPVETLERNLIERSSPPVHQGSNFCILNQPDHLKFDRELNDMMRLCRSQAREATLRSIEANLQAAVRKTEETIRQLNLPTKVRRKSKSKEERDNYVSLIYEISLKNVDEKENHINQ